MFFSCNNQFLHLDSDVKLQDFFTLHGHKLKIDRGSWFALPWLNLFFFNFLFPKHFIVSLAYLSCVFLYLDRLSHWISFSWDFTKFTLLWCRVHCNACYYCQPRRGLLFDSWVTLLSWRPRWTFWIHRETAQRKWAYGSCHSWRRWSGSAFWEHPIPG